MKSDPKHLTALTNIPLKFTSSETSLSESSSSETSLSESSSSFESSSSESNSSESNTFKSNSSETSSSKPSSSDSDIDEIINIIKHQRIREHLAQRKDQKKMQIIKKTN